MEENAVEHRPNFFMRWGNKIFIAFAFLLPIFFIPSTSVNFQFGKGFFLFLAVFVLALMYFIGVLKEGRVHISKSLTIYGLGAVFVAYLVSGVFSSNPGLSLIGKGFEIDTTLFMLVGLLLATMIPIAFRTKTSLFNIYIALTLSFIVVAIFNIVRFIFPESLSFGVFNSTVSNLVGTWNDLGLFAGFATIISLVSLSVLESKGMWRAVLYIALILGVFVLVVVNFNVLWWVIAMFSLVFFLYSLSYAKHRGVTGTVHSRIRQVSWTPLVVLGISVLFLVSGTSLGNSISSFLNISQLEARPSFVTTTSIIKSVLSENAILGAGPNQFVLEWNKMKPAEVNESIFWAIDFNTGVGNIPTSFVTVGGLGILAWIIFFVLFIFEGVRAVRKLHGDAFAHFLAFSSLISASYLWIMAFLYTPSHAMYALAFIFTGVFVATLVLEKIIDDRNINFADHPGKSFVGSLVTIVLIIASATCVYIALERFSSFYVFNRAVLAYGGDRNLNEVQGRIENALLFDKNAVFYRTLSDVYIARLNEIAAKQPSDSELQQLIDEFRGNLEKAIQSAQSAIDQEKWNYLNHLQLAKVYEAVVPLRIQEAYEKARISYEEASRLNPTNPAIILAMARLESVNGNNDKAREEIARSLQLKNNYTDAVFLLAQIEVAEGNTKRAIDAVSQATLLSPSNPVVFFQLGFLHYNDRNWAEAIKAFERAVSIEPQYANAKYFLGLSYDRVGRDVEAVSQFENLVATNPDNQEVKFILENLKAGRSPFANDPPIDANPERRDNLPVSDRNEE